MRSIIGGFAKYVAKEVLHVYVVCHGALVVRRHDHRVVLSIIRLLFSDLSFFPSVPSDMNLVSIPIPGLWLTMFKSDFLRRV
jgi:hypothetical protein